MCNETNKTKHMNTNVLFSIEAFESHKNSMLVTLKDNDGSLSEMKIIKSQFEAWIDRTGRLAVDTGMKLTDENVKNEPIVETRTWFEYYHESNDIYNDLYDYLLLEKGEQFFIQKLAEQQAAYELELN